MKRRRGGKGPAASAPPGQRRSGASLGRPRRWAVLLAAVLVAGAALYLLRRPLLASLSRLLVAADRLEKADAAVVLGGERSYEGNRVRAAVRLYREGWVRKVVLSGPRIGYGIYETELSLPLAVSQGIPKSDILAIPNAALSTRDEAQLLTGMLERKGIRSLYVVTANFHARRARRIFLRASGGRLRVLAYPTPDDWFDPEHWWQSREGRATFVLECLKSVNSLLE